jgi:hypothetical protein
MKKKIKGLLISAAAIALVSMQAAAASASTIRPAGFDECGTNSDGVYNCMYVLGSGDVASEVRGWSQQTNKAFLGVSVHEEVQGPDGGAFCNSATVTVSSSSQIVGCQKNYSGGADIESGQYCAILWAYVFGPTGFGGADSWHYANVAENCGTVSG